MKSQGKPGIVREVSVIAIQVKEKSRKTNHLVHIQFSLALCVIVCKVVDPFIISRCQLL